jgi:hypothetical protein
MALSSMNLKKMGPLIFLIFINPVSSTQSEAGACSAFAPAQIWVAHPLRLCIRDSG